MSVRLRLRLRLLLLLLPGLLGACTSAQVYNASQGWKQQECEKIRDDQKRQDCLDAATRPYSRYKEMQSAPADSSRP